MCAIFGLIDYGKVLTPKHRMKLLSVLSRECEVRGTDATGFAYNSRGRMIIYKRPYSAHKMHLSLPRDANVIMGHTRMTTQGNQQFNYNNHPFSGYAGITFALAHNGVIYNDNLIQSQHKFHNTNIETDSYVAVQLIEEQKKLSFDSLKYMAEQVRGSFMFTLLDNDNNMYFVRGDNPIAMYKFNGFYVYASTHEILDSAMHKLGLDEFPYENIRIIGGDIMKISADGEIDKSFFEYYDDLWDYYGARGFYPLRNTANKENTTRHNQVIDYARAMGFDENEVELLIDYGFDYDEIEELLYDPLTFADVISDILGYSEDDELCSAFCS